MTKQLPLFGTPHHIAFRKFHHTNPHVYQALRKLCLEVRRAGVSRFGIRTVWERLRWYAEFETTLDQEWKLNNNYTKFYARLLMQDEPELADLFEVREPYAKR
jgi:hypothetical protein|tara:strand:- start:206 stop:514 length:309 start_codon:yes stop_codon:yes gene_type:complete